MNEDEGIKIIVDSNSEGVIIDFGKPITSIIIPPKQARELAEMIRKKSYVNILNNRRQR